MGWVRMSDDFYDNDKMLAAGSIGRDLYWHGIAYCNRNLTDGLIAKGKARGLADFTGAAWLTGNMSGVDGDECAPYAIMQLLNANLWHERGHDCPDCGDPGPRHYIVHDYLKYQPSRGEIEAKAEANRERVRKWSEARKAKKARGNDVSNTGANALATPLLMEQLHDTPTPTPTPSTSLVETWGGSVTKRTARGRDNPRPQCSKHHENHDGPCRACKRRREWDDAHQAQVEADELNAKRTAKAAAIQARHECRFCDDDGWLLGADRTPADPAVKCQAHQKTANA